MTDRRLTLSAAFVFATLIHAPAAMAQTDQMRLAHVSMANQVGVMEYCMSKGWADQAAVDTQKKAAASLPAAASQTGLKEAEATGRKGDMMINGMTMSMASMAQKGSTTEKDLCSRMNASAKTVAAQQASTPGLPAMPNGGAMPTLPPGMKMPSMQGMRMPGIPTPGMPTPGTPMPAMPKTQ